MSPDFSNSITNLVPNILIDLVDKTFEEFLSYNDGMILGEGEEHLDYLVLLILPCFGGYPTEDNGGKGADLDVLRPRDVLSQSHKQDLGTRVGPVIGENLFSLGTKGVIWRLEALDELAQLGRDLRG